MFEFVQPAAGTKEVVEVAGEFMVGTWVGTADLVPGQSFVVQGPSSGRTWQDANRVVGVRSVEVVGDRTNTEVTFTDLGESSGNWSRMLFLTVEAVAC